jgi:DNA-binding Xre family transcriptional regulator
MTASAPAEVVSRSSSSPLAEIYKSEKFQKEWANDVRFHVAQNLVHLRRYRGISQSELADAIGTSQSAIARIESGQENITADTLERLAMGLDGRFYVSIHPPECAPLQGRPWWETIAAPTHGPWNVVGVAARRTTTTDQVLIGLERDSIASANTNTLTGVVGLFHEGNTSVGVIK